MTTWLGVWTRAVIGPAYRRAAALWAGSTIVAAVIFGRTAMHPRDITTLALHEPMAMIVVGGTWLLMFAPIARGLLHADEARYLRSLPSPRVTPELVRIAALVALQLPWLALWIIGEGARGLAVFSASTVIIVAVAWWRPARRTRGAPRWRSALRALRGIYLAALARRAGDALARGAGLAIFAGLAGGLFVRNNALTDAHAASIAASVIALVSVPAQVGVLGVLLDAHRSSTWLAESLGIPSSTRAFALALAIAVIHISAALLAIAGAAVIVGATWSDIAWIALTCLGCSIASSLGTARVILGAQHSPTAGIRMAVGSLAVAVAIIAALGLFGTIAGVIAILVGMSFALATWRAR